MKFIATGYISTDVASPPTASAHTALRLGVLAPAAQRVRWQRWHRRRAPLPELCTCHRLTYTVIQTCTRRGHLPPPRPASAALCACAFLSSAAMVRAGGRG